MAKQDEQEPVSGQVRETSIPGVPVDSAARAFVQEAANSALGGFGNALAAKLSGESEKSALEQEAVRQASPVASTVGSIAGAIAMPIGGLVKGGTALIAAAKTAGAAAAITAAQRIGEELHAQQMDVTPDTVAAYFHALAENPLEYLASAVLGAGASTLSGAGSKVVGALEKEEASAAKQLAKGVRRQAAVKASGKPVPEILQRAEKEGILADYSKAAKLKEEAGARMGELLDKAAWENLDHSSMAEDLYTLAAKAEETGHEGLTRRLGKLQEFVTTKQPDAAVLAEKASELLKDSKSAALQPSERQILFQAQAALKDRLGQALELTNQGDAAAYRAASNDYRYYTNLDKVLRDAPEQAGTDHLLMGAAGMAASKVPGSRLAGAAMRAITKAEKTNNYVLARTLAGKMTANGYDEALNTVVDHLFNARTAAGVAGKGSEVVMGGYHESKDLLKSIMDDPIAYGDRLHEQLSSSGMDPRMADALTVKTMETVGKVFHLMPQSNAPATMFDGEADDDIPDLDKLRFQREFTAHFKPLEALRTRDPMMIEAVRNAHPEIAAALDKKIAERLMKDGHKNVGYEARRAIGEAMGTAGVGLQNPLLGKVAQDLWSAEKARAAQGQQNSARVVKAVGNRDASMASTRANQITNPGAFK